MRGVREADLKRLPGIGPRSAERIAVWLLQNPKAEPSALARALPEGLAVWLLGSAKDAPEADEIVVASAGRALNLCGKTRLDQAIDLIAGAAAVVSNDSGLMHVAAALDRPLAAVYGSSSPIYTPPLSPHATIISLQLECSPCFQRTCPLGHLNCLEQLGPEQVLAHLDL